VAAAPVSPITVWACVSMSPLSPGLRLALSVAVGVATLAVLLGTRRVPKALGLWVSRSLAACFMLALIYQPALERRLVRRGRGRVAVVVDRSASMGLPLGPGQSRYGAVQDFLQASQAALRNLSSTYDVEFADLEAPRTLAELLDGGGAQGRDSDLLGALERAAAGQAATNNLPLSGLVLISDGADQHQLTADTLSDTARARLAHLGVPVNTLDATATGTYRDVAIAAVHNDAFAFVHNTQVLEVALTAQGYQDLRLPVTLQIDGKTVSTEVVSVSEKHPGVARFTVKPERVGDFVYRVSVPVQPDESVPFNNVQTTVVKVVRDKIRVLQVAGRPSWDERFLRQHLKENPNTDLVSFFILRTPTDDLSVPQSELSLIPFPVNKLFTTELQSFDVVIFQNFDYRAYHMGVYLPNIAAAVRKGLGFMMVGGPQSFGTGGYQGTALEEILPVRLAAPNEVEPMLTAAAAPPMLTEVGRSHPITDLLHGTGNNARAWEALPAWRRTNPVAGLAPNATALLNQSRAPTGTPAPLLAALDVEMGRTLALCTDATWRWRFHSDRDGGLAERAYARLWSNMLRWLVQDPADARVKVVPRAPQVELGDTTEVDLTALQANYQPAAGAHVRLQLCRDAALPCEVRQVVTGDSGSVTSRYGALAEGTYRLTATATLGLQPLGVGSGVFAVQRRSAELTNSPPRPALLAAIARSTGGAALPLQPRAWEALHLASLEAVTLDEKIRYPLWDNAWALGLGVALLAGDWLLRRRRGLT
jgi:uncharacterized membrane protein